MKINSVSPVSYKGNLPKQEIKEMIVPLRRNMTANLRVSNDTVEYEVIKNSQKHGTGVVKYFRASNPSNALWRAFEDLQKYTEEGYDFLLEFTNAILH